MKQTEFENLQQSVQLVFSELYLIDVETLTQAERVQHQAALSAAYLALVKAENAAFNKLDSKVKAELADLAPRIQAIQTGMKTMKTDGEKLRILTQDLDGFSRLASLIGAGS